MLIDDITIKIKAGDGGRGAVAFNKNKMSLGPVGGDGGNGGSVYLVGDFNLNTLRVFAGKKDFFAADGGDGGQQNMSGR